MVDKNMRVVGLSRGGGRVLCSPWPPIGSRLTLSDSSNITKKDLAIPDSYCNPSKPAEDQCPDNMKCIRINSSIQDDGGYAGFESFHISIFTVYQAASQEGLGIHHVPSNGLSCLVERSCLLHVHDFPRGLVGEGKFVFRQPDFLTLQDYFDDNAKLDDDDINKNRNSLALWLKMTI
ncbi:Sodium leak channel non-selective protein [Fasciola gigantica]|uniref:Sodium leak channel non-selective protein n=1 Tax=Fasciola gigantica TaxID=46835 RepID=A0A504YK20_FASGI|nr:Sodium leak channel non-selective protein [Fasciola gigantica]